MAHTFRPAASNNETLKKNLVNRVNLKTCSYAIWAYTYIQWQQSGCGILELLYIVCRRRKEQEVPHTAIFTLGASLTIIVLGTTLQNVSSYSCIT